MDHILARYSILRSHCYHSMSGCYGSRNCFAA